MPAAARRWRRGRTDRCGAAAGRSGAGRARRGWIRGAVCWGCWPRGDGAEGGRIVAVLRQGDPGPTGRGVLDVGGGCAGHAAPLVMSVLSQTVAPVKSIRRNIFGSRQNRERSRKLTLERGGRADT